jgi:murein L,D-transpeptidase YcbB/YkuD
MQMIIRSVALETQSQYKNHDAAIPVRQQAPPNGIRLAVDEVVKTLLFVAVTCLLWTSSAAAALQLRVDLSACQLSAIVDGTVVDSFPVAIGNRDYPTPKGDFKIRKVIWNPAWRPPDSIR